MEITFLGWVAIIITLVALSLKKANILLFSALFFSGFSGASVLNFGGDSLQPSFYFFGLYFLISFYRIDRTEIRIDKLLLAFFGYCAVSMIFPVLFGSNNVLVMGQEGTYIPLAFSKYNVLHICFLLFDLLFLNALLGYQHDAKMKRQLLNSFKWGFYAVVLVCLYQIVAFRFHLPFDSLFRQGANGNVQGTRLYGPCVEASMLCYYLIPAMYVVLQDKPKWWECIFVLAALAVGIMTYSSTFVVGLVLLILCEIPSIVSSLRQTHSAKFWFSVASIPLVVLVLAVIFEQNLSFAIQGLIEKLSQKNASGIERAESFRRMSLLGLRFPFGLGFGSSRSKDLFSTWLCNVGVFGMILYAYFLINYCIQAAKGGRILKILPYLLTVVLMMISVPEPYNLFVWYLLFYGYTSQEKANERNHSCGRERNKIVSAHNGDKQAALTRIR